MNKNSLVVIVASFVISLSSVCHSADTPKAYKNWWIREYTEVDSKNEPLVARAKKVFSRVYAAADKKGNRLPELIVVNQKGDPWAISIKDGSIIVSRGAIELCYRGVSNDKGDSRVAFVLGHELAHQSKDDFWHAAAFDALSQSVERKAAEKLGKSNSDKLLLVYVVRNSKDAELNKFVNKCFAKDIPEDAYMTEQQELISLLLDTSDAFISYFDFSESAKKCKLSDKEINSLKKQIMEVEKNQKEKIQRVSREKELQADQYGLIYMTMAGYDPKTVIDRNTNFFEEWTTQITGTAAYKDDNHPSPKERAEFLRVELEPVVRVLDYFSFGVRLYQLERYQDAISFFEAFKNKFPGREVFSNIGLSYYQMAVRGLLGCNETLALQFKLSTILDEETLAQRLRTRGGDDESCRSDDNFRRYMTEAIKYLTKSTEIDPNYVPAKVNLSSALIVEREFLQAAGVAEGALRLQSDSAEALNNKAVAFYLFGDKEKMNCTADKAIGILNEITVRDPSFSNAFYNLAAIQSASGKTEAAREFWKAFLVKEPGGSYGRFAKIRLGIKERDENSKPEVASLKSPLKLGWILPPTAAELQQMNAEEVILGDVRGMIYEKNGRKVLVLGSKLNNEIKIVEEPFRETDLRDFKKTYGEPAGSVKNLYGETLIYNNFAVDAVERRVNKIIYFQRD